MATKDKTDAEAPAGAPAPVVDAPAPAEPLPTMSGVDRGPAPVNDAPPVRKTTKTAGEAPAPDPVVSVRITKLGADKVSTGKHHPQLGDELYAAGEIVRVPTSVGEALEQRGFAEIQ